MNKKKIIIILIIITALTIFFTSIYKLANKFKNDSLELAALKYQKIHELYYFGNGLEYEEEFIKINNNILFKIKNYNSLNNVVTINELNDIDSYFDINKKNNSYYAKNIGQGLPNYYGTLFKIDSVTFNRIKYIASSKFCDSKSNISYLNICSQYYYIEKPFVLVKEDGIWKVDEYTSIFEFRDSEFK